MKLFDTISHHDEGLLRFTENDSMSGARLAARRAVTKKSIEEL
jgi:hypothetical protein